MSKKKTTGAAPGKPRAASPASKAARTKAAAATNPVRTKDVAAPPAPPKAAQASASAASRPPFRKPQSFTFAGVGRNDICPCGSGKKFKNCHGH